MTDARTIGVYDELAGEYDRKFVRTDPDRHLRAFLDRLPPRSHVLDLGCGPGQTAAFILTTGHTVDAVDASKAFVATARDRGVPARLASFDEIDGSDVYDGVWANFSLLHASRIDFARHLSALEKALKPSGLLHLGMKTGTGERRDMLGRFYTYYSEEELRTLLEGAGFSVVSTDTGEEAGLAGEVEPWIIVAAHA